MEISPEGDRYKVVIDNPKGLLSGLYAGQVRGRVMYVSGPLSPLCGQIDFEEESSQLEFCGEQFERAEIHSK